MLKHLQQLMLEISLLEGKKRNKFFIILTLKARKPGLASHKGK
jgi:hypothetical protein